MIGLLVLAAAIFLPKLLGGGAQHARRVRRRRPAPRPGGQRSACQTELEQISCAAASTTCRTTGSPSTRRRSTASTAETDTVFFTARRTPAAARPARRSGPFYCPADELVYFDLDFLTQLQNQFGAVGDLAAQYIVAHEYGHHVQNLLGISSDVSRLQQQDPSQANQYSVALELQADCFAGAWAKTADERGLLEHGRDLPRRSTPPRPSATTASSSRPAWPVDPDVHPRHVGAARVVVPPRLRHRRPPPLHHVPGALTGRCRSAAEPAVRRPTRSGSAAEAAARSTGPARAAVIRRPRQSRRRRTASAVSSPVGRTQPSQSTTRSNTRAWAT